MSKAFAFIDESGQRSMSAASSDHFVMAAVIMYESALDAVRLGHEQLRLDLNRGPGDHLTWKNLKQHSQRLKAAQTLQALPIEVVSVVVAKRGQGPNAFTTEDRLYLYALRLLLERLSWWGRDNGVVVDYTIAHITRFKKETLAAYEATLKQQVNCRIAWPFLDPLGGRLDQPQRVEQLQLADLAVTGRGVVDTPFA